jgi:uncharacterized membrane protein
LWAALALAVVYVVVFTRLAWDMHAGMRTHRSDLGQIDQAIWNSSRGRLLMQTDNGFEATRLTDHVEPILALISPIYWVWDDVRAILLLQVAAVAVGVLPLYLLTLRRCEVLLSSQERRQGWRFEPLQHLAQPLAFAVSMAYLLAPQLQSALLTEFHAAPLAVPLIVWAFWAVDARRWGQFIVAALLVAAVKEEMALLAAGLGVWAVWRAWWDGREKGRGGEGEKGKAGERELTPISNLRSPSLPRSPSPNPLSSFVGAAVFVFGLLWFYIATFVIVPAHAAGLYGVTESTYFQRYGALGDSSLEIVINILTRPDLVFQIASEPPRVDYLIGLFVIFAWLPLVGLELILLSLPLLLANLLSAYPAQYYGEFHYSAPLVAYFGVAAAYGVARVWRWLARRLERTSPSFQHLPAQGTGAMTAAAFVQNARTALLPLATLALALWVLAWSVGNYLLYGRGPAGGRYDPTPITAHHRLLDRFVAQIPADAAVTATAGVHPHVSHRRYIYQFPLGLDAPTPAAERAQWALLDVTTNTDMAPGDLQARVDAMLTGGWGVVDAADGFLLLAQGVEAKSIPDAFYSFTRIGKEAAPEAPLQLLSVTAEDWPRWRQTKLIFEWLVGEDYDPDATPPTIDVLTPQRDVASTLETAAPPALIWHPPAHWQPGERIRVTTLPLSLPRTAVVHAAGARAAPAAIFRRLKDGRLVQLPDDLAVAAEPGAALAKVGIAPLRMVETAIHFEDGVAAPLRVWVMDHSVWPGGAVDLWLQWGVQPWPQPLAAFVHLRRNGETVAQADGAPTFWQSNAEVAFINDWRQVTVPPNMPADGLWSLALGVYDPATGQRVPLSGGDELIIDALRVHAPPAPDQACALIPAACASQ